MQETRTPGVNITRARIIEAAVQLFSRHGFKGTSTRAIADLADVNEVTLFRYFAHKTDLFWAAAASRLGRVKFGRELQTKLAADGDPIVVVPLIVRSLIEQFLQQPELMRLLCVAAFELAGADSMIREQMGPAFDTVSAYFQRSAARRVIRDCEPALVTLGLFGAVIAHQSCHRLFTGEDLPYLNIGEATQVYAELWLHAIAADHPPKIELPWSLNV